jgi:glycosyltransferase involved in cell wall biosynthesis
MMKGDIAIIHPNFTSTLGGAKYVAFTALEALSSEDYNVDFYSEHEPQLSQINEHFGLDIKPRNVSFYAVEKPRSAKILERVRRFSLLQKSIEQRKFSAIADSVSQDYDKILFTSKIWQSQSRSKIPSTQYVHQSISGIDWDEKPKPYRMIISLFCTPKLKQTETILFNSRYTRENSQATGQVVNPPVPDRFDPPPFDEKADRAIIAGRISPDKRTKRAVKIIGKTDLDLLVAGIAQDDSYVQEIEDMAETRDWLEVRTDLSREELDEEIEKSKIGLNCRKCEDFGITVVEYMRGGTIPVVHNSGAPKHIVPSKDFVYNDTHQATGRIQQLLENYSQNYRKVIDESDTYSKNRFSDQLVKSLSEA